MKTIAFQGEPGAFSELAAFRFFNGKVRPAPRGKFEEVFKAVLSGTCDFGIVPIENSLSGSIHENYDLLLKYPVWISGEVKLRISHCLIANPGVRLRDVRKVYSHPVALSQCRGFLKKLKNAEPLAYYDTAGSVKFVRDSGLLDSAAIASQQAADDYGMNVLSKRVEDNEKNFTRFFILTRKAVRPKGDCKTSVVFALKNMPGALYKSLSVFAIQDIDLHKIESRPILGSPWKYIFYLDFEGDIFTRSTRRAVEHLKEITAYLKILGSYRAGREILP
ncbi:MAG: prephenate dehydratase [Fibrobacterota bacterium]